ncbi:MAG: adenosine kinase [Cyclobacteriaceae bacterium]|nr:adenosine kinase [Cyclobacteriaceae bacterium]
MIKILGLGNALVDLIINIEDDSLLQTFQLPKGSMVPVDAVKASHILEATKSHKFQVAAGGSASNTIDGLACLGIGCGYIGKIGHDPYGELFREEMISRKVNPVLLYGINQTGTAITLLTPDAERTFATYLGAAIELSAGDINEKHFSGYDYLHIEGYLVQNHHLITHAVAMAKNCGLKISMDMASYNMVDSNKDFLVDILEQYVDIVFANEEEAKSLTGKSPEPALHQISQWCDISVVKIGKKGSWIKRGNEVVKIEGIQAVLKDTTGAGDLYASGFLYGLVNNLPLLTCGNIASLIGGNVVEVYGARMGDDRWEKIKARIREMTSM